MESWPQNPEFRINPEHFHPSIVISDFKYIMTVIHDALFSLFWFFPSQSTMFLSHVGRGLPWMNLGTKQRILSVRSCSKTHHSASISGETRTCNPSISSQAFSLPGHCTA